MRIGFIGAGTVAKTIAKHALAAGHQVVLSNSRGPETLAELVVELGPGASAGTAKEAAGEELVVLASSWPNVQPALFSVADWSGKVLVDATNRVAGRQRSRQPLRQSPGIQLTAQVVCTADIPRRQSGA